MVLGVVHGRPEGLARGDVNRIHKPRERPMSKIGKKILKRKSGACTTEELGELLLESIKKWSEEEKAQAREVLLKDWLMNMPCSSVMN
jgi:hypothetical protein